MEAAHVTHSARYHNPLAAAMPPGFEHATVSVKVTSENFADVMTVVAEMVRNGADFTPIDRDDLRSELAAAPLRTRKPSIATLVKRAEKTGRPVTSVTTLDGITIRFDESKPTDADTNPWDVAAAALRLKRAAQ